MLSQRISVRIYFAYVLVTVPFYVKDKHFPYRNYKLYILSHSSFTSLNREFYTDNSNSVLVLAIDAYNMNFDDFFVVKCLTIDIY